MGGAELVGEGGFESWRDVAKMYEREDGPVPRLSKEAAAFLGEFLRAEGCELIGGYIPNSAGLPIGKVMGLRSFNAGDPGHDTFVGPHIMGEDYYPNGVGVWSHATAKQPEA